MHTFQYDKVRGLLDTYVMNTYGRWCIYFHVFLTWALGASQCSASRPDHFTLPGTHPPVSRVGSTASLTLQRAVEKRKISCIFLVSNPDSSAVQPVMYLNYVSRRPSDNFNIIYKFILKYTLKGREGEDWIHLAHNMNQLKSLVKKITIHGVPLQAGNP